MIGAMPAVAVRHERRKQDRRKKRPSQLGISSPPADSIDNVGLGLGSPEPLQSPPHHQYGRQEYYVCGKVRTGLSIPRCGAVRQPPGSGSGLASACRGEGRQRAAHLCVLRNGRPTCTALSSPSLSSGPALPTPRPRLLD